MIPLGLLQPRQGARRRGPTYDRSKPTRVFVGEFANNRANNAYSSAMAEAAYWTGLERNSDMVVMAAYAPLFCKKGFNKWDSNLIWFDNRGMWRSTNYYYQKLFTVNIGNSVRYEASLEFVSSHDTSVKNQGSQNYYSSHPDYAAPAAGPRAGERPGLVNMAFRFGRRVKYTEAVVPHTKAIGPVQGSFDFLLPENAIAVLRLTPVK